MEDMCLDNDIEESYDDQDYEQQTDTVDRGGQFHLQNAILPVRSMLPGNRLTKFQRRVIEEIMCASSMSEYNTDQIALFKLYIKYVEDSHPLTISQEIKQLAMEVLTTEGKVFEELFEEKDMCDDINRLMNRCLLTSRYVYHIKYLQKAVFVYNFLLSKRLGDDTMKVSYIKTMTDGKGALVADNTVVVYQYDDNGWCLYITRELIGWRRQDSMVITTPSVLLNLSDKCQERFNLQIISEIGALISPTIYPSWSKVKGIIAWGDNVIDVLGNEGYGLLASFESLMISEIIKQEDGGYDQGEFQRNIIEDITADGIFFMPYITTLLELIQEMSHCHIAQLHGLYRIWGHPEVDSYAGMKKVGDLLHQEKSIDTELEQECTMTFREVFFTNYFDKHGFYPPYTVMSDPKETPDKAVSTAASYICSKLESNTELDVFSTFYNRKGWTNIIVTQCFPLPTGLNIASFLKDRAVSPSRNDLIEMINTNGRVTDPFKRRGVLMWLANQPLDIPRLLRSINGRDTGLSENDCTIGLYPKEREMKLQARMFALMSYRMRVYFVTTEEMLSHHVLQYFPQIAMNDNFLQIQNKFVSLTTPMAESGKDTITYIVNIDFKKWNQQMRRKITEGVFTDLGRMFGLPELYNRTYDIFKNSYVYLCNGTYLPRVYNGKLKAQYPLSWEGDDGGKEGLRQKGWTIVSAMDLFNVCRDHSLSFKIIGGGDNQVLIITMPKGHGGTERTHGRMRLFLNDLDMRMKKRGLPLKIGETWVSSSLFAYNKYMIYKGVQLPSTLKLASRCFHLSNTDLMTIENMFGTLAVSYQSIISKDHSCLTGWLFSRLNAAYYMKSLWEHHPFLGCSIPEVLRNSVMLSGVKKDTTFKNQLTLRKLYFMLFLFPRVLGGSGTISLFGFLSRGFPDNLSEWLSYLYLMKKYSKNEMTQVIEQVLLPTKRSVPQYSRLLEDPCSLSLDSAEIGSGALRNIAEKYLADSNKIQNKGFIQFIQLTSRKEVEDIAETLCSNKILIPRELHDIMGATIYGYMNSIIAKIDKSTTINKLGSGINVVEKIRNTERNWINYCGYRLTVRHGMKVLQCPTRTAEAWRSESWEKKIIGVTTPHPTAFLRSHYGKFHQGCDGNFIMHINLFRKYYDMPYTRSGPCHPYLGSYTREKSLGTELASAYGNEPLVRRPIHLQKLIGWRYENDGCMAKIIRACLKSVTDLPNEFLISDPRCVTGDAEHRYKDKATKHEGVINNLYYWGTWCRTLTDSFIKHSRGGKNETLQFQTCMLYIHALSAMVNDGSHGGLSYFSRLKTRHIGEVHYHECCDECIVKLEEPPEHLYAPRMFPAIPTCPSNPYLYVRRSEMVFPYSELRNIEEYENTTVLDSIEETYDIRTALSLLMGCRAGRGVTGSKHKEEKLTESSIRLILGKVHFPTLMSGMINYIIAWKLFSKMVTNNIDEDYNHVMINEVVDKKAIFVEYFEMLASYHHQRAAMQGWCRANNVGISLGDIEAEHIVQEILKRAQMNSSRMTMTIHKTRGESVTRKEQIIRAMMGMKYIASECTECQNYLRQYLKGNIARWCLCPHSELQTALKSPMSVWPEGIEAIGKKTESFISTIQEIYPRPGYLFTFKSIEGLQVLSKINVRCTRVTVPEPMLTHTLSNFPAMYQLVLEAHSATRIDLEAVTILDTYDGNMENICKRNNAHHGGMMYIRWFRKSRKDYYMMKGYMKGDHVCYRLQDSIEACGPGKIIVEVCCFEEMNLLVNHEKASSCMIVCQVHINQVLNLFKWLASVCYSPKCRIARISQEYCSVIIDRAKVDKNYQCINPDGADMMVTELRRAVAHNQSRLYDTWCIASSSAMKGTQEDDLGTIMFGLSCATIEGIQESCTRVIARARYFKKKGMLERVDTLVTNYLRMIALRTGAMDIMNIINKYVMDLVTPRSFCARHDGDDFEERVEQENMLDDTRDGVCTLDATGIIIVEDMKITIVPKTIPRAKNVKRKIDAVE